MEIEKDEFVVNCKGCDHIFFTKKTNKLFCSPLCGYNFYNNKYKYKKKKYADFTREQKNRANELRLIKIEKQKNLTFIALGDKCARCGFSDRRAFQIDHINGGGVKELKENMYSRFRYLVNVKKSYENGEKKYQLLCANCNWIKRHENKETRKKVK